VIRAWGRGEESWLVYWGEIYGDPGRQEVWVELDGLLNRGFPHVSGQELHIISAAIDTGGHHAQDVYAFARRKTPRVIAIKGASTPGRPVIGTPSSVDVTWQGQKIPNGVQLWPVGTDIAKGILYSRLKIIERGPGCYHWPIGASDEYFIQLTAEKLTTHYVKDFPGRNGLRLDRTTKLWIARFMPMPRLYEQGWCTLISMQSRQALQGFPRPRLLPLVRRANLPGVE